MSPITALDIPESSSPVSMKSAPPTIKIPTKITAIPVQRNHSNLFFKKTTDSSPTNIMMDPKIHNLKVTRILQAATTERWP